MNRKSPSGGRRPRWLPVICLGSAFWAFQFGLAAPLTSLWLRDAEPADTVPGLQAAAAWLGLDTVIGLNTGIYYLGIAVTAAWVPGLMRRWGRSCPMVGMAASGLTVAVLPWVGSLGAWFLFRYLNGAAGAMSLIPMETFVNRHSAPGRRARNFGYYAFAVALGWAAGNLVGLQMYVDLPRVAMLLGGLAGVLAALALLGIRSWPAEPVEEQRTGEALPFRRHFLSFGSAWSQGFLEGGMVAFLAIYLLFIGMPESQVSWLTSGIMIGVILFQVPVAWLADRLGRTPVLLACYAVTAAGLAILPSCGAASAALVAWLFFVGACSGAFYPLGLALLGEELPPPQVARASAWYLAINCCGSLIGPVVTGAVMDRVGKPAMFTAGGVAVAAVVAGWLVFRRPWLDRQSRSATAVPPVEVRPAA